MLVWNYAGDLIYLDTLTLGDRFLFLIFHFWGQCYFLFDTLCRKLIRIFFFWIMLTEPSGYKSVHGIERWCNVHGHSNYLLDDLTRICLWNMADIYQFYRHFLHQSVVHCVCFLQRRFVGRENDYHQKLIYS